MNAMLKQRTEELSEQTAVLERQAEELRNLDRIRDTQAAENLFLQAKRESAFSIKEDLYRQAIELFRKHDQKIGEVSCLRQMSADYQRVWNYPVAVAALEDALAIYESDPDHFQGDDRPGWYAHNLSKLLHELGDYDRETELLEKQLGYNRHALGERHDNTCFALVRLAVHLDEVGASDKAAPLWAEINEIITPPSPTTLGWPRRETDMIRGELILSDIQFRNRNPADVRGIIESSSNYNLDRTFLAHSVAKAHALGGNIAPALKIYEDACASNWQGDLSASSENLRRALTSDRQHTRLLTQLGLQSKLEAALTRSIYRRDSQLPSHHPQRAYVRQQLAKLLSDTHRPDEAKKMLLEAEAILDSQELTPAARLAELYQQLADVDSALGNQDAASHWQAKAEAAN
jgi:tetratricopeptide (TPR) repeat protein